MKRHVLTALLLCVALCLPALAMAGGLPKQKIDVVWLIDTTGSIGTETIDSIRDKMDGFAATLPVDVFDVRYSLAAFGDEANDTPNSDFDFPEETVWIEMGSSHWTNSCDTLKSYIQQGTGMLPNYHGGDYPEPTTNAIVEMAEQIGQANGSETWRNGAFRQFILVTDALPKESKNYTVQGKTVYVHPMEDAIKACKDREISVSVASLYNHSDMASAYGNLVQQTGGKYQYVDVDDEETTLASFGEWVFGTPFIVLSPAEYVDAGKPASLLINFKGPHGEITNDGWETMAAEEREWRTQSVRDNFHIGESEVIAYNGTRFRWKCDIDGITRYSNVVTLRAFAIAANPTSTAVDAGANASFTVEAMGDIAGFQWQKKVGDNWTSMTDGNGVSGATTKELTLSGVQLDDSVNYRCVATSKRNTTLESGTATLTVFDITKQPEPLVDVDAGKLVSFAVEATGDVARYQWEKLEGSTWKPVSGATDATLQLSSVKESDSGTYHCVVTSERNTTKTSGEAKLSVAPVPAITAQPQDVFTEDGKDAVFSVATTGEGMTYQWQEEVNGAWTPVSSATGTKLTVTASPEKNGRRYRCVVKNRLGTEVTSSAATLTVTGAPAITLQPQDVFTEDGKDAVFSVATTGEGMTYQWQEEVNGAWTPVSSATGTKLTVTASPEKNGRRYRCVVKNRLGTEVTSRPATLTVTGAPAITLQPKSLSVAVGQDASFTIEATGYDMRYQWQVRTENGFVGCPDGQTPTLTLKERKLADDGSVYRCVVRSGFGTELVSDEVTLSVLALPDLPETGDSSRLGLWAALCAACVLGLAALKRRA